MLVRHYIRQRLRDYYAQPSHLVVGSSSGSGSAFTNDHRSNNLRFRLLLGEWHWKHFIYAKLYRDTPGQWLTPVELFAPHYSHCIAQWIAAVHRQKEREWVQLLQSQHQQNQESSEPNTKSHTNPVSSPVPVSLSILELGAGRGTNALAILDWLQAQFPSLYPRTQYTLLDASQSLHDWQTEQLCVAGCESNNNGNIQDASAAQEQQQQQQSRGAPPESQRHADKIACVHVDLYNVATQQTLLFASSPPITKSTNHHHHTVVLGLEILDNLPHDKIMRYHPRNGTPSTSSAAEQSRWCQTKLVALDDTTNNNSKETTWGATKDLSNIRPHKHQQHQSNRMDFNDSVAPATTATTTAFREVYTPLTDPLLQSVLHHYPHDYHHQKQQWIPTVACGVLQAIARERPTATVLLADFDALPPPTLPQQQQEAPPIAAALGEPLVTDMDDVDQASYLIPPTRSPTDILFPTAFERLATYCRAIFATTNNSTTASTTGTTRVQVIKQGAFLQRHGDPKTIRATTSWFSGYSPMIEDFGNCSILTVVTSTTATTTNNKTNAS